MVTFEHISHRLRSAAASLRLAVLASLARLDPRTVRMRDPSENTRRRVVIAASFAGLLLTAGAALAASGGGEEDPVSPPQRDEPARAREKSTVKPASVILASPRAATVSADLSRGASPATPRPARFFDPIYVFTREPAAAVEAYPMADPPGLVVNLSGTFEKEDDDASTVGEDDRIRAVRRRATAAGVRYIIGLTFPVERIEVVHDGNMIMIAPLR